MVNHLAGVVLILTLSVAVGMVAHRQLYGKSWSEAFAYSALVLSGNGPDSDTFPSLAAAVFTGLFALYAQLVFLSTLAIVVAPVIHRVVHTFAADIEDGGAQITPSASSTTPPKSTASPSP